MSSKREKGKSVKHKIFIVDDHPIVCQGLLQLINEEADFEVSGYAADIPQTLEALKRNKPEIIIVDISLGQSNGIRLIENLTREQPEILILVLSMHDEYIYAERCFKAGAKGYVMKQEPPDRVIVALRKILNDEIYISDKLASKLLHKFVTKKSGAFGSPVDILSNRELEVFQLIGQGLKTKIIAEQLNISSKTVETYVEHIKKKMNFSDSRDLMMHAVKWSMNKTIT